MVDERVAPERVVLRAYGQERHYLRDLPLPSQHELMETDSYADFEYTLRPTNDFKDHVVIFSEAKERLSRMQSQARLSYAEAMVSRQAVKPGLPYEIHFLLKLKITVKVSKVVKNSVSSSLM